MKKSHVKKSSGNTNKTPVNLTNVVYGVHSILELLAAKRRKVSMVYTTQPFIKAWPRIQSLLPSYIQVQYVDRNILEKIAGSSEHQGIVAIVQPFPFESKMFDVKKFPFLVVLDGIQDVRNLGAIIRSSYCAGVDGIILSGKNSAPLTAAAIKASAGLAEHSRIYIAPSLSAAMTASSAAPVPASIANFSSSSASASLGY